MAITTPPKVKLLIYLPASTNAKIRAKAKKDRRPLSTTFEVVLETYFAIETLKQDAAAAKAKAQR